MSALNREAVEVVKTDAIHTRADSTGFGLLGHLSEMVRASPRDDRFAFTSR